MISLVPSLPHPTPQGCNGGYPYLVGKSVHELGILEEHCMPYTATQVGLLTTSQLQ